MYSIYLNALNQNKSVYCENEFKFIQLKSMDMVKIWL